MRMKLVLRLVETGIDGSSRSIDVLEIVGRSDPGDIAALGVTLSQGKQLLALIQQEVVAAQCRGFWRMSGHPAVQQARRNHDFGSLDSMSLPKFNPVEPPWYGPVCPVVWEGRHREMPPLSRLRPVSTTPASVRPGPPRAACGTAGSVTAPLPSWRARQRGPSKIAGVPSGHSCTRTVAL